MSSLRGYSSSSSQRLLEPALTAFLDDLFCHWYGLPLVSTRRPIDQYRYWLAATLNDSEESKAEKYQATHEFITAVAQLPGVTEITGKTYAELGRAINSRLELDSASYPPLVAFLKVGDPAVAALSKRNFAQHKLEVTLRAVCDLLQANHDRFPTDVQAQIDAVFRKLNDQLWNIAAFEPALRTLESIPAVLRVVWKEILNGKLAPGQLEEQTFRGGVTRGHDTGPWAKGGTIGSPGWGVPGLPAALAQPQVAESRLIEAPSDDAVTLFSDVHFPSTIKKGDEEPLIVRLTRQQMTDSRTAVEMSVAFADRSKPELVDVVVSASGFGERFNAWHRTIKVYSDEDSEPAIFLLKSEDKGKKEITVDFYHKDRMLGSAVFGCTVGDHTSDSSSRAFNDAVELEQFLASPPKPADLELRIVLAGKTLHFTLHSANPTVGYHWHKVGERELKASDPTTILADKFNQLNRLARISRDFSAKPTTGAPPKPPEEPLETIASIGVGLWDDLIPQELKDEYWGRIKKLREEGVVKSLLITSDEPWIPWEMLKPYRVDQFNESEESDLFLAEGFEVCRWLSGRGPAGQVSVTTATIVAPVLDLKFVKQEVNNISKRLKDKLVSVGELIKTVVDLKLLFKSGGAQVIHFATHGNFEGENVEKSKIALQDGVITPGDLALDRTQKLRQARPLIFLNACNGGRIGFALTDLGGWAEKAVKDLRASAFIGAHWEVNDALAASFADVFYGEILAGTPLGAAFHAARLHIQKQDPANPTWLAYTLYADPNSRLVVKSEE